MRCFDLSELPLAALAEVPRFSALITTLEDKHWLEAMRMSGGAILMKGQAA